MRRFLKKARLFGGDGTLCRSEVWLLLLMFLLTMGRYCAFGFTYYYQLDDYIQYINYPNSGTFSALCQRVGLLTSRPLAGIFDYFVWGQLSLAGCLLLGVGLVTLLYVTGVVLLRRLMRRYFQVGPAFLAIACLLPLGMEGLYWMSASSRVAVGLFFAALAGTAFARWLDTGKWYWALGYAALQLIPFGFYEQAAVFSMTLVLGMGLLEWGRDNRLRPLLALWSLPAMAMYFLLLQYMSAGNHFAQRMELLNPFTSYYVRTFLPELLRQIKTIFLDGTIATTFKGFLRGLPLLLSPGRLLWLLAVLGGCVLLARLGWRETEMRPCRAKSPWLAILAGFLLALAPLTPFFLLGNTWVSLRNALPSFPGAALMLEGLLCLVLRSEDRRKRFAAVLAAGLALLFSVASLSEMNDYRLTWQQDRQVGAAVLAALERDQVDSETLVGVIGIEASYLDEQNFTFHEHIHGCTESDWALSGLLTAMGNNLPYKVTPLPRDPMYRRWNRETCLPDRFGALYFYDGEQTVPVTLERTGDNSFLVLGGDGEAIGAIWEDEEQNGHFTSEIP